MTPPCTPTRSGLPSGDEDEGTAVPQVPAPFITPLKVPAREVGSLSLATPPSTPPASLHSRARALLRSTSDADVIGRETERRFIMDFLTSFIDNSADSGRSRATSLYVSGKPGTGKTALVSSIMTSISHDAVQPIYVNCMGLKDLSILWERVLTALGESGPSKSKSSSSSLQRLERVLERGDMKWWGALFFQVWA